MSEPLVSVIINCFNGGQYLKEAIDTVYAQTYNNWEIIFWDNASTDDSAKIAQSYDSRIKYYRSDNTKLLGEARVLATNKAEGAYLAFLDSDDLWVKDKLQKQMKIFKAANKSLGLVYGRTEVIYGSDDKKSFIYKKGDLLQEGDIFGELAKENFITFSSVIVDKEKFFACGGFPKNYKNSTDYWIFMHMAYKYPVAASQDVCCMYRVHQNNLSSSQKVLGVQESIDVISEFLPDERAVAGLKYHYIDLVVMYIKEKKIITAMLLLIKKSGYFLLFRRIIKKFAC